MKRIKLAFLSFLPVLTLAGSAHATEKKSSLHLHNPGLLRMGSVDEGLIIARPIEIKKNGYLVKTWELTVNPGLGSDTVPYRYSMNKRDIYEQVHALPLGAPYIFHYKKSIFNNWLTRFWRDTAYEIVDVFPVYLEPYDWIEDLPLEYGQHESYPFEYASGHISGVLLKVQQWGQLWPSCTLTVHQGGTKLVKKNVKHTWFRSLFLLGSAQLDELVFTTTPLSETYLKSILNTVKVNVNSKKMCAYAESILPYGRKVDIGFSQSYTEIFDYSRVASQIRVLD